MLANQAPQHATSAAGGSTIGITQLDELKKYLRRSVKPPETCP